MPSKLYSGCGRCSYKDSCSNKRMESHGYLQPAASNISENLEDIKKRLAEDFYRSQGIGIMLGG